MSILERKTGCWGRRAIILNYHHKHATDSCFCALEQPFDPQNCSRREIRQVKRVRNSRLLSATFPKGISR